MMVLNELNHISPFVRKVKITESRHLTGKWTDFDHVFTYIQNGKAEFVLNGIKYHVKKGDIILIPPLVPHIIRSTSEETLIQYIFHFDLFYNEKRISWKITDPLDNERKIVPEKEKILSSIPPISTLDHNFRIETKKKFIGMYHEYINKEKLCYLKLKSSAIDLLFIFLKNQMYSSHLGGKLTKGWIVIKKTINTIQYHYSNPNLNNLLLSDYVGYSPSYISSLFRSQLGITVHNYITHTRMIHAKKRMLEGNETLTTIAKNVGYTSIYSFSRAFKKNVGITPSDFIKSKTSPDSLEI